MKKIIYLFPAFFVLLNLNAQIGYHIQTPIGNGSEIYVLNNDSVYMSVGVTNNAHMVLIHPTTKEWKYLNTNPLPSYGVPIMKNKNNGILLPPGTNSVQVTTDGWQTVTTSTATIKLVGKSPAGYYGANNLSNSTYSLYFSTNGLNWSLSQVAGSTSRIRNFGNKVIALGTYATSYISMDGGQTYANFSYAPIFASGSFVDFQMLSADTFYYFTTTSLVKSFNGGVSWTITPLPAAIGVSNSIAIKNKNEFAVKPQTGSTTFYYTLDAGSTWSANIAPQPANHNGALTYINNSYYLYPFCRTSDYGATWEHFLPNLVAKIWSLDFNASKGLFGMQGGRYGYSLDKGRSVTHFTNTIGSGEDIMASKVLSNGTFLAGDRKGQIYTSSNNGLSWQNKNTSGSNLNSVRFLTSANENTIVLTRAGLPMVSTDAGATFSMVTYAINGGAHATAIKPNGQLMDARDVNGFEMRTFDPQGNTNVIYTYTSTGSESLAGFYMVDNNVGYVMTRDNNAKINKIYKTTDGGNTFVPKTSIGQVSPGSSAYINTQFVSGVPLFYSFGPDTIIVAANYNPYYHISVDGAATWSTIITPFNNLTYGGSIFKINFFTSNSYIASTGDGYGPKGLYMNATGGSGGLVAIKDRDFDNNRKNLLLFPNPSKNDNPIHFLNTAQEVLINVINLNGQVVKSMETISDSFSIEGLSSGMYIVQVIENGRPAKAAKLLIQ